MNVASASPPPARSAEITEEISLEPPTVDDGVEMWRLARDCPVLDLNSRYAYLLWSRDFAATSVVARLGGRVVGFVTGYRRPSEPSTLLVWQVAVDLEARGQGIAGRMLDTLVERVPGVRHVETTITPSNLASITLFTRFAERWGAPVLVAGLFSGEQLTPAGDPDHEPEDRYRIGPLPRR